MDKIALLFAGQGAQHPGMGEALMASEPAAHDIFTMVDRIRPKTSAQCFFGTKQELGTTINTQPCTLAVDLAVGRTLMSYDIRPAAMAGFSLGELAALAMAGAYSDEEAFRLVCRRAQLMQNAAEVHPGSMRAVIGLASSEVESLSEQVEGVWPANYNSPKQTVVAGTPEALSHFDSLVRAAGGRSLKVAVSGAFHSPLMDEASKGLSEYLTRLEVQKTTVPVIANMSGKPYPPEQADERTALLAGQPSHPVRWVDTLKWMANEGICIFIEVGPGHTLTGFVKRSLPDAIALPCETPEQLADVLDTLKGRV